MPLEHIAINVREPRKVADWYIENLGFTMRLASSEAPFMHFIADKKGMMLELYYKTNAAVLDSQQINPVQLHFAFESADPQADHDRLIAAGATSVHQPEATPEGHVLTMLRDPWGLPIQFVKRAAPL